MPERIAIAAEAARRTRLAWRTLLELSRPAGWPALAAPFAIGAFEAERTISMGLVLGVVFLLAPFGLLLHGSRVIASRADGHLAEGPADGPGGVLGADTLRAVIAATNLPLLAALVLIGGAAVGLALAALVAVALALTRPPLHLRSRPGIDLLAAGSLVPLAAMAGLLLPGGSSGDVGAGPDSAGLPWVALLGLWAWGSARAALMAARRDPGADVPLDIVERSGVRTAGIAALVGFGLAAVLPVAIGPLGLAAAAGLALFLLVPPPIVRATAEDAPAAAARTARAVPGLVVLVGAWLGVLLLHHWGALRPDPWTAVVAISAGTAAVVLSNVVATRIASHRRHVPPSLGVEGADDPSLAIIVPSLDAIERLPATLASLRAQTYADPSILLVDLGSCDGSPAEAAAWIGDDAVISGPPPPPGWAAREWAWHVGATTAGTELLLLVDDGTMLAPIASRILVEQLRAGRRDLLSGVARHAMPTVGERAGVPSFPLALFGLVPIWWSALTGGRPPVSAFADPSLVLVRRTAYLEVAGDPSGGPIDARALARRIAAAGGSVGTLHVARLASNRAEHRPGAVVRRWRRGFPSAVGGHLAAAVAVLVVEVLAFVLPFLLPLAAILAGVPDGLVGQAFVPLAVLAVARLALVVTQHHPPTTIAWHPVTVGLMLVGQVAAIVDLAVGRTAGPEVHFPVAEGTAPDRGDQGQAGQQDPDGA